MERFDNLKITGGDFPGSLVVDIAFQCRGTDLIPGQGVKIPHSLWPKPQNIKQKQHCNKFSKDFKNGPQGKKNESLKTVPYSEINYINGI